MAHMHTNKQTFHSIFPFDNRLKTKNQNKILIQIHLNSIIYFMHISPWVDRSIGCWRRTYTHTHTHAHAHAILHARLSKQNRHLISIVHLELDVCWHIIYHNWKHEYQPNQWTKCCHHFKWRDFSFSLFNINNKCHNIGIWHRTFVKTAAKDKQRQLMIEIVCVRGRRIRALDLARMHMEQIPWNR